MVQMQTYLNVADNSGAKRVQCIKVLGGSHRYVASVGDIIVVAVKDALRTEPSRRVTFSRRLSSVLRRNTADLTVPISGSMTTLALSLMPTITHAESVFSDQLPVNFATAT